MTKYKLMTEQLRMTNSDEDVANYLRWILNSATEQFKELSKQYPNDLEFGGEVRKLLNK